MPVIPSHGHTQGLVNICKSTSSEFLNSETLLSSHSHIIFPLLPLSFPTFQTSIQAFDTSQFSQSVRLLQVSLPAHSNLDILSTTPLGIQLLNFHFYSPSNLSIFKESWFCPFSFFTLYLRNHIYLWIWHSLDAEGAQSLVLIDIYRKRLI